MNMHTNLADLPGSPPASDEVGAARQYVTFHIADGLFAVPLADVQEIIRMPDVVHMPLSHASLVGLANLRGAVMSVTSLRRIFRYADADHDDATRVVVLDHGVPMGLVVDRMAEVVSAEPEQIESVSTIEATISSELIRGMIKTRDGRGMITILDPVRLIESELGVSRPRADRSDAGATEAPVEAIGEPVDELQLVSFEVAGQEYALAIENVQEIVQVPTRINHVPKAEAHVLGVVTLRERLLPLVSLREMFGLPAVPPDARNKIVVVPLPNQTSVGIVMDAVREVLRVNRSQVDPVPALMRHGGDQGDILGICRLDGGKRLVSVLAAEALFMNAALRQASAAAEAEPSHPSDTMEQDMADQRPSGADAPREEEQFVVFRLAQEEYGAPIESVQEIVRVPADMTRVPKAPDFIKGIVNLRGAVLPVVDQRTRFALPDSAHNDRQRIMVFMIGGIRTGFIVDSVTEVIRIAQSAIGPTPALSEPQSRLIARVANLPAQKRMILLIDVDQLLAPGEIGAVADAAEPAPSGQPAIEASAVKCSSS